VMANPPFNVDIERWIGHHIVALADEVVGIVIKGVGFVA